jgi:hypothetical protein
MCPGGLGHDYPSGARNEMASDHDDGGDRHATGEPAASSSGRLPWTMVAAARG